MKTWKTICLCGVTALAAAAGCGQTKDDMPPPSDVELANEVVAALVAACPIAAANDEDARAQCAAKLSDDKFLSGIMREPFLWGGQSPGTSYHPEESNMNRFNVFVWRRMYLSLIMFTGESTVEETADGYTVVRLASQFRNALDMGSYPYPFWHSKKKWDSYQYSTQVMLLFKDGQWIGAMRAAEQDTTRSFVAHTWSGQWQWEQSGQVQPYVSLYKYLLSPSNPHAARLDTAYRDLSAGLRNQACMNCHSPDNFGASKQLEFFNYPNQALYARNDIIKVLGDNTMPPAGNALGLALGIQSETDRQDLITLAREFKAAGDAALGFEGELKPVP